MGTAENAKKASEEELGAIKRKVQDLLVGLSAGHAKAILQRLSEEIDNGSVYNPSLFLEGNHGDA